MFDLSMILEKSRKQEALFSCTDVNGFKTVEFIPAMTCEVP
jgi:hypothetical protein